MNEIKPNQLLIISASVLMAVCLASAALWMSPNNPDRVADPHGGSGQAERPLRGIEKAKMILSRVISGESWTYGRRPVWDPLIRALPQTLRVSVAGLLLGWVVGFLLGCWAGACRGGPAGWLLTTGLLIAVIIPGPIWVCCCRMALIDTGIFRLSDHGFAPASLTIAVLATPLIALNQSVLVSRAIRRSDVRFAHAVGLSWLLRWRVILWHCRSYWYSELALLGVAFCEGSMLVERVFGIKGIGDAMYLACTKSDPCLVVTLVGVTATLVNVGVVATSKFTALENRSRYRG